VHVSDSLGQFFFLSGDRLVELCQGDGLFKFHFVESALNLNFKII
jgi:hypothetical protein